MSLSIRLVEKSENDGRRILTWRNDETTRKNSFNQNVQHWEKFQDIFYNNYFNHILQPLFVTEDNIDIAVIGFCETDHPNKFNMSINIGPAYRGKGLSVPIIHQVTSYLRKLFPFVVCIGAEIKASNIPSIKAFSRSGFVFKCKSYKHNTPILAYTYRMAQCKFAINDREIDEHSPTYFIAELSCNHNQDKSVCFSQASNIYRRHYDYQMR
jgi:RimJ/RimL family protein N-acetyltransferase